MMIRPVADPGFLERGGDSEWPKATREWGAGGVVPLSRNFEILHLKLRILVYSE